MNNDILYKKIISIAKGYPVAQISIFGSRARGDYNEKSDLDLLIKFDNCFTASQYFDFWDEIENSLDITVDILSKDVLSQLPSDVVDKILYDERRIYEI